MQEFVIHPQRNIHVLRDIHISNIYKKKTNKQTNKQTKQKQTKKQKTKKTILL